MLIDINAQRSATSASSADLLMVTGTQANSALLPIPHAARARVSLLPGSAYASMQAAVGAADKGDVRGVAFPAARLPISLQEQGDAAGVPPRGSG